MQYSDWSKPSHHLIGQNLINHHMIGQSLAKYCLIGQSPAKHHFNWSKKPNQASSNWSKSIATIGKACVFCCYSFVGATLKSILPLLQINGRCCDLSIQYHLCGYTERTVQGIVRAGGSQ